MATYGQLITFGPLFSGGVQCTGLRVYHYIVGTTTLKDVYVDREKASTAAQPVASDSNGIVSFYADGLYKFRIDGSTDGSTYTTLYTYDKWAVGDLGSQTGEGAAIVSASTLVLGTDGDFFHVTGTTGPIVSISGQQNEITLTFDSTPTLTHSGSLILQYAADYVAAANVTMKFRNEGSNVWREVSRTPAFADIAAKGDLIVGSANDTVTKMSIGSAGSLLLVRAAATSGLAYSLVLNSFGYGHTYANGNGAGGGDLTNDILVSPGGCMDATGAYFMVNNASLSKQLDAAWAVGTAAGGLDTGSIANTDYYIWAIARSDTGVVDFLFSISPTAPTMPANYDFKRVRGWFRRVGGTIVSFHTYETEGGGLELLWDSPTLDINESNALTTTRRTDSVKVPADFSVVAMLNVVLTDAAAVSTAWIYCPDQADLAPSSTAAPLSNASSITTAGAMVHALRVRTSSVGQIAARSVLATVDLYAVSTIGFIWARRN